MTRFDVAVVGAGPAGAIAARDLARAGASVAILDGSHPREKPCGGGVTGRALTSSGIAWGSGAGQTIRRAVFEHGDRRSVVDLPDDQVLRVFPREAFDRALLDAALAAGATLFSSRAVGAERGPGRWRVALADRSALDAGWLLAADGAASGMRKRLFRPFERRQLSIAAGAYVDAPGVEEIVVAFVDRPHGYLWSFPRSGHLAAGTCAQADETSSDEMQRVTDAWLDRYPPARGYRRRRYVWPIPSLAAHDFDREQAAGDGWMLLGDAAGLVDPITREGLYFAVRSGQLAAAAMAARSPRRSYGDALRAEIYPELQQAARLKAGFFRPRFTGLLVDALDRSPAIRDVMVDLIGGRQPYAGLKRRLLATLEIGLMFRVLFAR